jgi:5-formyltetrahydrofolate cyclo-ligase
MYLNTALIAKSQLRKKINTIVASITAVDKEKKSKNIVHQLTKMIVPDNVRAIYLPTKNEPQIQPLFHILQSYHNTIVLPQIQNNTLKTCMYDPTMKTIIDKHNINIVSNPIRYDDHIDVILVPWLGFDHNGHRLWHGFWRYDRFLLCHPHTCKVWVCFQENIVSLVPIEKHDIIMNYIISDT